MGTHCESLEGVSDEVLLEREGKLVAREADYTSAKEWREGGRCLHA